MRKLAAILIGSLLLALVYTGVWAVQAYDVSPRFLAARLLGRLDLESSSIDAFLVPPEKYVDRSLDGVLQSHHPRLLLPGLRSWSGEGVSLFIERRLAGYKSQAVRFDLTRSCQRDKLMSQLVCWLGTGNEEKARQAIDYLLSRPSANMEDQEKPGDSWQWALAFDLLLLSPQMSEVQADTIRSMLRGHLRLYLRILDDESVSLWHGRSSMAAQAWILAVTLHSEIYPGDDALLRRAQGHFQQTLEALALTEAWPEGYNYWINSRALILALAASAYVNGLQDSYNATAILRILRRVGLWTVYATRPDDRIEALADEGPRVDLKDETRRVIDLLAQTTRDKLFSSYSRYLQKLHGSESYYRHFQWGLLLFNDPTVRPLPGITPGSLSGLTAYLPRAELFGANAMNLFIARSGWLPDDTFITMRGGHTFTHHGHYDAGHFTLFKGTPLASNSSIYNGVFTPHRLYYGLRTVSKNSLLVLRPGEMVKPNALIKKNVVDGGQRIVMPTGSRIRDVEHWRENLGAGAHYEGGLLQDFQVEGGQFAYTRVDITGAYDNTLYDTQGENGKVSSVIRELLYLFDEDRLLIHDRIISSDSAYTKKWLLHTIAKPFLPEAYVLKGSEAGGIIESQSDWVRIENGRGRLDVKRILPENALIRLVGGKGYKYYVESDGLDGDQRGGFNGDNFSEGADAKKWFDNSSWRIEIQPSIDSKEDHFLIALSPSIALDRSREVVSLELESGSGSGLVTPDRIIVFSSGLGKDKMSFSVPSSQSQLFIVGVNEGDTFKLLIGGSAQTVIVDQSGVLQVDISMAITKEQKISIFKY